MKLEKVAYTLAENLKDLLEEKNITNKELCKLASEKGYKLNESLISDLLNVDLYSNKKRYCNYDKIVAIADTLNVSIDYLLGLSKTKSLDTNYKLIGAITGLSDEAILRLENWNESVDYMDYDSRKITTKDVNTKAPDELNKIIESPHFRELIDYIRALNYTNNYDFEKYPQLKNRTLGPYKINILKEELGRNNTRNYIVYLIQSTIKELVDKLIPNKPIAEDVLNVTQADFKDNIDLIINNWAAYQGENPNDAIENIRKLPNSYIEMLGDYIKHKNNNNKK